MNITPVVGQIEAQAADAIIVHLFEGIDPAGGTPGAVDRALGGALRELMADGDFLR